MSLFRRLLSFFALIAVLICVMLLLNFTASNPTGRRYSSAPVLTSGSRKRLGRVGSKSSRRICIRRITTMPISFNVFAMT